MFVYTNLWGHSYCCCDVSPKWWMHSSAGGNVVWPVWTFRALSGARMHHRFGYPLARWITGPDVMIFPFSNFFMMISKCCFLFRTFWKDLPHQVLNCSFACLIGISGNSDPLVCLEVHHLGGLLDDGLIVDLMTLDCDWLDWWLGRTNDFKLGRISRVLIFIFITVYSGLASM